MARMTEEESFALDEKWTKTTPKVGPNGESADFAEILSKKYQPRSTTGPEIFCALRVLIVCYRPFQIFKKGVYY